MKLAEALMERADLNRKIHELQTRILSNVLVQDGETPNENPVELCKELDACIERYQYLIAQINLTNCKTIVDGKTLTEWIAIKDSLLLQNGIYRSAVDEAGRSVSRVRGSEIKIRPVISVVELQKKADDLSKDIRQIDNRLQQSNWMYDLIEE